MIKNIFRLDRIGFLVVDPQNDFCPDGALAVTDGDEIVPVVNNITHRVALPSWWVCAVTRDWHPKNTPHFDTWPKHCIADTQGAEFHKDLDLVGFDVFSKGVGDSDDYSGFDGKNIDGISLKSHFQSFGIKTLVVAGLATDYCVQATVLDGLKHGFNVVVVSDAIRAVNLKPDDGEKSIQKMLRAGAILVHSNSLLPAGGGN